VKCTVSINHTILYCALWKDYETCGLQHQKALHLFVCLTHCWPRCWIRWTGECELPASGVTVLWVNWWLLCREEDQIWGDIDSLKVTERHDLDTLLLWSSYHVNSSTVRSFYPKAMLMLSTARSSAYVRREVFVGRISSCGLLPANSVDYNPHDLCCMTIMARCWGSH